MVGIAQCRVLDCDFKGCRCKSYYLPIILTNIKIPVFLWSFTGEAKEIKININHSPNFLKARLKCINISSQKLKPSKTFSLHPEIINIFTKKKNWNKLYVQGGKGFFLSSGIILRYLKQKEMRCAKKRLKTWYTYLKAIKIIQKKIFIVKFDDLFGKKSLFFDKMCQSKIKIHWFLIRLFYKDYTLPKRGQRRIKRWVKKKYFQFGINEKK